jgi:hypothetical protein
MITSRILIISKRSLTLAGKAAYFLIGTYHDHYAGLQKVSEIGTITGNKAYSIQYIADAPRYSEFLPIILKMIHSLHITMSKNIS